MPVLPFQRDRGHCREAEGQDWLAVMVFVKDGLLGDRRYAVFIAAYPEVHGMLGGIFAKELPGFANGAGKDFFAWRRRVYHRFSVRDVSVYQSMTVVI